MKNQIFLVIIYMILKIIRITLAKTNPESNLSEGIHAILIHSPKHSENNASEPHLIINIHMNPSIELNNVEDSWILDEVYDPTKRSISKIISPYLVVVGRGEPVVMYPLQYKETIKHQEFRKEQATMDDRNPKGSPSSNSGEPGPLINLKEREEVKDVHGSPFHKAVEANPAIIMKDIGHDKDVKDSSIGKNNEPRPSINMNESRDEQATKDDAKDAQDSPPVTTDDPRHSINMKEPKDEQHTKDVAKSRQGIQFHPSIKGSDDKGGQFSASDNERRPSISNINDREDEHGTEDGIKASQGSLSSNSNELNPLINSKESQDDEVKGSLSIQINEPGPSKQLIEGDIKDSQGLQHSKTNNPHNLINIKEQKGVEEAQRSLSGETKESLSSINMEKRGSPFGKANDLNIKECQNEQPNKDDVKNLRDPSSRNESEIFDASRMKRNQGLVYSSKKSVGFNIAFLQKTPNKSKAWNPEKPFFTQDYITSLGLIEIKDPSLKKDRIENPKELGKVQSPLLTNNKNKEEKKDSLRPYQFYMPEQQLKDQKKINQIKKDPEAPMHNFNNWGYQLPDKNSKSYQEGKDNNYLLKSDRHLDKDKDKDFTLFDQAYKRKHIIDEIKNYKPSFQTTERKESYPKVIDSNSNENDFSTRSQSPQSLPHEREENHNFKSHDNIKSRVNDGEQKPVQDLFRVPYTTLLDSDNAPNIRQDSRYDFKKPLNVATDLNNRKGEYFNDKTAGDNVYTRNYPLEQKIKNKYYNAKTAVNSFNPENNLPQGKAPEQEIKNEYYNDQTVENNIYSGNYPLEKRIFEQKKNKYSSENYQQGRLPENEIKNKYFNGKTDENNIYTGSYLAEEKVFDSDRRYEDYNLKKTENKFNIDNDLSQRTVPEPAKKTECYNFKTDNIYKEDYLPQESIHVPVKTLDYYNDKPFVNNFFIKKYLPQENVPEHTNPTETFYKGSDLLQDANAKTAENNIYKNNDPPQERVSDLDRKYNYNDKDTFCINKYLPQERVPEVPSANIYRGSDLLQDKDSEHDTKSEYYNAKAAENSSYKGNDQRQERVSDFDRKYNYYYDNDNYFNKKHLPQESVPEHTNPTKNFYKGSYLLQDANAKTAENNIYKDNDLPQERVSGIDRKYNYNDKDKFRIKQYLPQEKVPEVPFKNIYKGSDLLQDKVSEQDKKIEYYNAKTAENNSYKGNDQREERVSDLDRKYNYYYDKDNYFNKKYLPQESVPEHTNPTKNFYKGSYLLPDANDKKAENNIYKDNDLPQERVSGLDRKYNYNDKDTFCINKYLPQERVPEAPSENIYKGSDLLQDKVSEHDKKSEYYNAKTAENNSYKGNDQRHEKVSDLDRKYNYYYDKYNLFIKKYLPQESVPEHANPSEKMYKVPEYHRKSEYYNAKTAENNIYKEDGLPKERNFDLDRKYDYYKDKTGKNNYFIKKFLPQGSVPEHANPTENIYKGIDLLQDKVLEHDGKNKYYNAKTTENIYQGNDQVQGRVPKHEIKNEYYNGKTPENNIYTGNDLPKERLPEYDRKIEYYNANATENTYKESDLSNERVPTYDRKNEYYNAKTSDNRISKENELTQEKVPEYDQKNKYYNVENTENIYKASDLPQEKVPEHEIINTQYMVKTAENVMFTKNDLPEQKVPEFDRKSEYNDAKRTENIYKESDINQERKPELDRKNEYYNIEGTKNISNQSDLPQESEYKLVWKNKYNEKSFKNSVKEKDLTQGKILENDIKNKYNNAKAAQNNIYRGYDPKALEDNIQNIYYNSKTAQNINGFNYPSSRERKKFKFNEPMKSVSGIHDVKYPKQYDQFRANSHANSFPKSNVYSLRQKDIDFIISQHMRESLKKKNLFKNEQNDKNDMPNNINPEDPENIYKNGQPINWKCSESMPNNLNPTDLHSDLGPPFLYSKFPDNNPFSSYPKTNPLRSVPRNYKRTRRSSSPRHTIRNKREAQYISDPNPQKGFNLQKMEENGEVPCDTCGGKNKKKGDKPPTRFCSALTDPKSHESKMEDSNAQGKLNDVIPCDTCGGKNKKIGGKTLPGGLDSEIRRVKVEIGQQLTAEDMIPCERCKVNRDGNLASQSCGCVSNPSVCSCEGSKLSRAPDQSFSSGDLNYGVFNMNDPIPYLTTQLRVFRRRHNTWWRIVPIVTVDSVLGIFANKNMSMIFSTRVGTLRQDKSARFLDHKLVIPLPSDDQLDETKSLDALTELQNSIGKSFLIGSSGKDVSIREITNSEQDAIKGIDVLGYFPVSMNALQMCPHNDKNICLNIRGERVPEFSIKIKIPFRENAFMVTDKHVVKISNIITDATTKDALHISIDVINKGLEAHEYSIFVYNCPLSKSALSSTSVRRQLQPEIGQTVTFLLPFINGGKKNKIYSCDVVVKESDSKNSNRSFFSKTADVKDDIISKRLMDIMVHARCFCIARCRCHCMQKLDTFVNYKICERMSRRAEEEAGLIYNCPPGNEINDICITDLSSDSHKSTSFNLFYQIQCIILILLIWLLIFGLLKAIFGLCIQPIDKWGFEAVQPGRYYACTSRIRIFIVNVFFFIIYPFTCWCKCFKPKPEDLMAASTDWSCNHEMDDDDLSHKNSKKYRLCGGGHENLLLAFTPHYENGLFKDDKLDDEESTAFIMEVLEESKTSLSRMMSQSIKSVKSSNNPEIVSKGSVNSEEERAAETMVDNLKTSQRAYRIMKSPVGGVINIPENCQYCVKGFFLPTLKGTYEFFSYHPLVQYISVSKENEAVKLQKPEYLHTEEFSRNYANKLEVLKAGDLSVGCPPNVPCINITPLNDLESSFVKLSGLLKEKHSD